MNSIIPLGLYKVTDFAEIVAGVPATVGYAGANAFLVVNNNGTSVGIIPENSIIISGAQVLEITAQIFSGGEVPTRIIYRYQRIDANQAAALKMREIVLKPGETLIIRVFNRAPAAAVDVAFSISYYEMEVRVYDQVISRMRAKFESEVI